MISSKHQNIILAILALAIGVLYILHFTQNNTPKIVEKENDFVPKNVVFINIDSFFKQYEGSKKMEKELKAGQKRIEKNATNKMEALKKDYVKFMQDAQTGRISPEEAQRKQQSIVTRQGAIEKESQAALKRLADKTDNETKKLYKKLNEYFSTNKEKYNAEFVMGYQTNGKLLYYNPDHDITKEVVEDLNNTKK